jgi:hypothetical protein
VSNTPVLQAFLTSAARDAERAASESDVLRIAADPNSGTPPSEYRVLLLSVEHFERDRDGSVRLTDAPVPFSISFPRDYLSSADPMLPYRVVRVHSPLVHPNHRGGVLCLTGGVKPGTRLRSLVEIVYGVVGGKIFATDDALDRDAAVFYLREIDRVRALRSPPLWRRRVAASVRVETIRAPRPGKDTDR